jgi:hypothetical protein
LKKVLDPRLNLESKSKVARRKKKLLDTKFKFTA